MDPAQRFLYRKPLKRLKKFWNDGEEVEAMVAGFMHGRGVFIQTNQRQVWAPFKWTKRRVKSQPTSVLQVLRKDEKAAIKCGAWVIQNVDRSRVADFVTKPNLKPQPKRLFTRAKAKLTKAGTPPQSREENARKARARMLYDKGQISKGEYDWIMR